MCRVLRNKTFWKNSYDSVKDHQKCQWRNNKKIATSNPNWLEFWTFQGIWSHKTEKGSRIVKSDMASEKNMRMEEVGKGPQEMQEEIAQMKKMGTNLTKRKGITDDLDL